MLKIIFYSNSCAHAALSLALTLCHSLSRARAAAQHSIYALCYEYAAQSVTGNK